MSDSVVDLGLTAADIQNFRTLMTLLQGYNLQAYRKHHFGVTVTNQNPVLIPWTAGRIASVFIPGAAVFMGGDPSVTTAAGGNAGLPIVTNAQVIFGPEEGDSATYLISQFASVDVRCLELIPITPPAPS